MRCDCGGSYGLGHVSRCLNIAAALSKLGYQSHFVVQPCADEELKFIKDRGFPVHISNGKTDEKADIVYINRLTEALALEKTIILLDSRDLTVAQSVEYMKLGPTICIDDQEFRDLHCNILVNGNYFARKDKYTNLSGRLVLAGIAYNFVDERLFITKSAEKETQKFRNILISTGGEDPNHFTVDALRLVSRVSDRNIKVNVVIGPSHPSPNEVVNAAQSMRNVNLYNAPNGIGFLIEAADLALTACGTTCYELMAARVPILGIIAESHQRALAESLAHQQALVILGGPNRLVETYAEGVLIDYLFNADKRKAMKISQAGILPEPGLSKIVHQIVNLAIN